MRLVEKKKKHLLLCLKNFSILDGMPLPDDKTTQMLFVNQVQIQQNKNFDHIFKCFGIEECESKELTELIQYKINL